MLNLKQLQLNYIQLNPKHKLLKFKQYVLIRVLNHIVKGNIFNTYNLQPNIIKFNLIVLIISTS
jgi:hypothetical protein